MTQLKFGGIRGLEVAHWCKRGQMWVGYMRRCRRTRVIARSAYTVLSDVLCRS